MSDEQRAEGDNSVTEKGTFLSNAGELIRIDQEIKELAGQKSQAVARAKSCGINVAAAKIAIQLTRGSDEQKRKRLETYELAVKYAAMLNAEAVTQFDMFARAAEDRPESRDGKIFEEGQDAGRMGASNEPPFGYGNAEQQHWLDGYKEGSAERKRVFDAQAEHEANEADDDIPEDDVPGEDYSAGEVAASDDDGAEPATEVKTFADEVAAAADEGEPDIPQALDRKNWTNGKPPESDGADLAPAA